MGERKKPEEPTAALWYVSFSDLVTNMLCFFIMLFAFSSLDSPTERKTSEVKEQMYSTVFSINSQTAAQTWLTNGGKGVLSSSLVKKKEDIPHVVKTIKNKLSRVSMADRLKVTNSDQMVKIQIPANVMFESGSTEMKAGSEEVLKALVPVIAPLENYIRVDGHTDDTPTKNSIFPTNWELSAGRACRIVRYFTDECGLDPERFSAQGFANNRPKMAETTPEARETNRRVELIILNEKVKKIKNFSWD
ncbi:MAG: flagellar motor protein MotB [Candidatus Riflebacteria bacterium]|nr:flagellar motor protein MotB [Candidatus Riflebacteria bacterium]